MAEARSPRGRMTLHNKKFSEQWSQPHTGWLTYAGYHVCTSSAFPR